MKRTLGSVLLIFTVLAAIAGFIVFLSRKNEREGEF